MVQKIEIIPEDIILKYIENCLNEHWRQYELPFKEYFARLPLEIELSEDFLTKWKKMAISLLGRHVTTAFKYRQFLFLINDQVVRASPLDEEFWRQTSLNFSDRAVYLIWQDIVGRSQGKPPNWQNATPSDALLLALIDNQLYDRFDFDWLYANKAPWLVVAMFLRARKFYNPCDLPWKIYFNHAEDVPLPLRDLLIEHTANFFWSLVEGIQNFARKDASTNPISSLSANTTPQKKDVKGLQNQVKFTFNHAADILRLYECDTFSIESIRKAINAWTGHATVGFDDSRYIEGAVEQYRLYANIEAYQHAGSAIGEILKKGEDHEQKLSDYSTSNVTSDE